MARKGDYRTFYTLVKLLIVGAIGFITLSYRFLREVNRLRLWSECLKSLVLFFVINVIAISTNIPEVISGCLIVSVICFCWYWHKKFSYIDTRLNREFWQERAWWWTLDGWQFEQEVAKVFRACGYKATVTKGSGDGGVDIIITNESYKAIVQCKHYKNPVPPEPMRALWGCKDDFNANEVIMVASSGLTTASTKFIQNKPEFKVYNLDDIIIMAKQSETQDLYDLQVKRSTKNRPACTGRRKLDI